MSTLVIACLLACRAHESVDVEAPDAPALQAPLMVDAALASVALEPPASTTHGPATLPALTAESWLVPIAVDGYEDAMVAVPLGSREPRRLIVALHGNFDRPDWACSVWRAVAGPGPWILCPRGKSRADAPKNDPRWTYAGAHAAELELRAATAALHARYGARIAEGPAIYAGFSLGAIVGTSIVANAPRTYSRLVFVEGGHSGWTAAVAKRFAAGGGERALFVCAQPGCVGDAKSAAATLTRAGVRTKVAYAGNHGHAYDGPVADVTRGAWDFITAADAPDAH